MAVTMADVLDAETRDELRTISLFFEEMIECVAACGCWADKAPAWDATERLARFAREGFRSWDPGISPADVLFALEWCLELVEDADMEEVRAIFRGLYLPSVGDFRRFFAPAARVLAEQLGVKVR